MKSLLVALLITVSTAAHAEIIPDTSTPDALGKAWATAIQDNSTDELKRLLHPDCAKGEIKPAILSRMVSGGLPPAYTIDSEDMTTPTEQLDRVFLVRPTKNLLIHYVTANDDDKRKYGMGKGFPIAQKDGSWYFAVCAKK
jgi:hypothetical protein